MARFAAIGVVWGLTALVAPQQAGAQAPVQTPARVIRAQGVDGPSAPGRSEGSSGLSDEEKLTRANGAIARMKAQLRELQKLLEGARAQKDVVKLNCINEKLTQVRGLVKVSEQADISLQEAAAKRERDASDHEFAKINIARTKVDQLRAEAEECVGQLAYVVDQNTTVEVESPKDLPEQDVTHRPPPAPPVARPPPASQFE